MNILIKIINLNKIWLCNNLDRLSPRISLSSVWIEIKFPLLLAISLKSLGSGESNAADLHGSVTKAKIFQLPQLHKAWPRKKPPHAVLPWKGFRRKCSCRRAQATLGFCSSSNCIFSSTKLSAFWVKYNLSLVYSGRVCTSVRMSVKVTSLSRHQCMGAFEPNSATIPSDT